MVDTTDTAPTDTEDTTSARGLLMLNLKQMPKLESHFTAMLTVSILMVSVPTVLILMLMVDTTVTVSSPEPRATNTFLPLPPPTVSASSHQHVSTPAATYEISLKPPTRFYPCRHL